MSEHASPDETAKISVEQIHRGAEAVYPFVKAWDLPLNPENVEFIVFAVLKHAGDRSSPTEPGDYEKIAADVQNIIAEEARSHEEMMQAMAAYIESRS